MPGTNPDLAYKHLKKKLPANGGNYAIYVDTDDLRGILNGYQEKRNLLDHCRESLCISCKETAVREGVKTGCKFCEWNAEGKPFEACSVDTGKRLTSRDCPPRISGIQVVDLRAKKLWELENAIDAGLLVWMEPSNSFPESGWVTRNGTPVHVRKVGYSQGEALYRPDDESFQWSFQPEDIHQTSEAAMADYMNALSKNGLTICPKCNLPCDGCTAVDPEDPDTKYKAVCDRCGWEEDVQGKAAPDGHS